MQLQCPLLVSGRGGENDCHWRKEDTLLILAFECRRSIRRGAISPNLAGSDRANIILAAAALTAAREGSTGCSAYFAGDL
jgi:hypothetical protein